MNKVWSIIKDLNPFSNKKVDNKIIYTLKKLLSAFIVYFASLIIAEGIIIGSSYLFGYLNLTLFCKKFTKKCFFMIY